jgi:hypothetical protein
VVISGAWLSPCELALAKRSPHSRDLRALHSWWRPDISPSDYSSNRASEKTPMSSSTCMADRRHGMVRVIKMTGHLIQFDWYSRPQAMVEILPVAERFTPVPVRLRVDFQGSGPRDNDERAMSCLGPTDEEASRSFTPRLCARSRARAGSAQGFPRLLRRGKLRKKEALARLGQEFSSPLF